MKSISLKMSKNFKIEPLCKNNVYELENNSAMVDIECEVDSTLTYKMHISHGGTKSFVVMTKNESSISTMLTAPILNSNGVYYIQIEGIKTDYRIVSNQIRFEAGSFINAESIPTPSQQGVIDQILIRLDTAEGDIDDLEEDVATLTTSVGAKADKSYVDTNLATKQDKLVAGSGISIASDGKTISATGGAGNVDDVKINGTSIVDDDKVANIPVAGYNSLGLVKGSVYVSMDSTGAIFGKTITNQRYPTAPSDAIICKSTLDNRLAFKQDKLTAGANITISEDNVISATGGGSSDVTKAYVDEQDEAIRNSIPTDVSDLNNDSGYLTPNTVGQYVPTKTSQLTNDSDFTTTEQVATQLDTKQNVLTAGTNITIVDDVISSTASGGSTVTMSDNANAGVDLTVDGTSRTLAKSSELATVNNALLELPSFKNSNKTNPDLDISDEDGNVLVRFEDGHIKTKNFDSSSVDSDLVKNSTKTDVDLDISDSDGNVIMRLKDGNISTKNFDSSRISIWTEKKYISHGDSITWYDGHTYPDGTTCIGYQSIMNNQIGFDSINNQGWSGHSMADGTTAGDGCVTRILSLNHTAYDLCTIACGTNDFKLNVPLGNIGVIGDTSFDRTTFYGAYRTAIEYLLSQKPTLRIGLFTPLQRNNSGYDVNYTNTAGHKLIDYVNAIKSLGQMYGLPVCDMYSNSGFTQLTLATYTIDGLHPSNDGFARMGNYATQFVNSIGI